jgi:hypothetical protein
MEKYSVRPQDTPQGERLWVVVVTDYRGTFPVEGLLPFIREDQADQVASTYNERSGGWS